MKWIILAIVEICNSYPLFRQPSKGDVFNYTANGLNHSPPLLVPARYDRRLVTTDSAGNQEHFYYYKDSAFLYFAHAPKGKSYQPIQKSQNIPKEHPQGGLLYKGLDSTNRYWREVQMGRFRFGYRNVPGEEELRFDSSVNYVAFPKVRTKVKRPPAARRAR